MVTVITGEFARRFGGDLFTRTGRSFAVIGVAGCLLVAGLAGGLTGAGAAFSAQADIISVDRTHKGDRLSLLPKPTSKVSLPAVTTWRNRRWDVNRPSAASSIQTVRMSLGAASPKSGRCLSARDDASLWGH